MMLGMSQTTLGDALELTFQQVQKYEKGTNRIGASRLQQIAKILQVPVSFFFENAPGGGDNDVIPFKPGADIVTQMLSERRGADLARAFIAIKSIRCRSALLDMAEALATVPAEHQPGAKAS
jgi:transcriptional regulator with XRE-family HTH domain